jgi:hypothetical protein
VISKPACIHRTLDGNVQEFIFMEISRRAVDELFDLTEQQLQSALESGQSDIAGSVLIDSSLGLQSVNHSLFRLRGMIGRFPSQRQGRIALILPSSPLVRTIAMMMRPIAPMRIYMANEREAALTWLRSPIAANTKQ